MRDLRRGLLLRLPFYYHCVRDHFILRNIGSISSALLASNLGIDDTQVRKDLSAIGVKGRPRVGFHCQTVLQAIRDALGFDLLYDAVIMGMGRLGGALACYDGFRNYGLNIIGIFDADPRVIGTTLGPNTVQPIANAEKMIREKRPELAVITVPASAAQACADLAVSCGVIAIWNFAPTLIHVPETVYVRNEHLSVGLSELSYRIHSMRGTTA